MSDIRKRITKDGKTIWQVRHKDSRTKSGYAYKSFHTAKLARDFHENSGSLNTGLEQPEKKSVVDAVTEWLEICEKEGLDGKDPITNYSLENYTYRAKFMTQYPWQKTLQELTAPDIVEFRSWLLRSGMSRELARMILFSFQSVMKEMTRRGYIKSNCAIGISVRDESRYKEPLVIPSKADIKALLAAADALSVTDNETIANAWKRYRPMLYLAVETGMRPQEYIAAAQSALTDKGIHVGRAISGDGREISVTKTPSGRRFIELSPNTVQMLRAYIKEHGVKNDFDLIFANNDGGWIDRRNWQHRGFDVACKRAGLMVEQKTKQGETVMVPKFRPYDLRHFFASLHLARNTNLKKIQKLMGHKNTDTLLNVYGHLLPDDEDKHSGILNDLL